MLILLDSHLGALEIVEGKSVPPAQPAEDATAAEKTRYEREYAAFKKARSAAMLLLTGSISDELMERLTSIRDPREMWLELIRLFGGVTENRAYDLCMQFFSFKPKPQDEMAAQLSELKTL